MSTQLYPWLEPLWQQWQVNLEAKRFSNASLLLAEEGMGAEQIVERVTQALMCNHFDSEPCGFCHSCQLMRSQTHPDFHVIAPEKAGKAITVDQIRECNRFAQESSQLSGMRVIVITPANAMNESASNALLKTLETPSERCIFILVANQAQQMLPTIVSRCQQWRVMPPSAQQLTDWLATVCQKPVPSFAAHINGLSPLKTQTFIEQGLDSTYQGLEKQLIALCSGDTSQLVDLAKRLVSDDNQPLIWLWYLLCDAQKVHFGLEPPYLTPGAHALAKQSSYHLLYTQTQKLQSLIGDLKQHTGLNKELLILNWLTLFVGETCM